MREIENLSRIFAALFEAVGVRLLVEDFFVAETGLRQTVLHPRADAICNVHIIAATTRRTNAVLQPYTLGHEYFCACVVKLVGIRKKREIQALFDCFAAVRS